MGRKSLSTPTLAAPGLVYPLPSGPPPATTRLPRLRLETEDERAALRALKLLPGNRFQKRFEGLILAHLALIRDACNLVAPKQRKPLWWPVIASPDGRVSNGTSLATLRCQAAASISVTADRLEKKRKGLRLLPETRDGSPGAPYDTEAIQKGGFLLNVSQL